MGNPTYVFRFNNAKRECAICGKKFKPESANSKYCGVGCRKIAMNKWYLKSQRRIDNLKKRRALWESI